MDAVALALPTTALTAATAATADKTALSGDGASAPIDFATLLVTAGLDPWQSASDQALMATKLPCDKAEDEGTPDPTALPADAGQMLAATAALPAASAQRDARGAVGAERRDGADAAALKLPSGETAYAATKPAAVAVDAAGFAAAAAGKSVVRPGAPFEREPAQRVDAAADVAVHALGLQAAEPRPLAHQPTAVLDVAAPVHSTGFADALSQRVVWMADKDTHVAELRIDPPELGPVEVRLRVNGDQASVQFVSIHQDVREALETSIARLRESFAAAGIQLGQASVGTESFRDRNARQSEGGSSGRSSYGASSTHGEPTPVSIASATTRRGLVDTFA